MKLIKTRDEIKKYVDYTINYQNGVSCDIEFVNKVLINYRFVKKGKKFDYVNDLKPFRENHWSLHEEYIKETNFTFDELKNFTEFDKLFYIGAGSDGMVLDIDLIPQTSIVRLDSSFFSIYQKIETSKKECEDILKTLNDKYIIKSSIYYIPGYNQDEDCNEHHTLDMSILLPQTVYVNCLDKSKYVDDEVKIRMFEWLKDNREKKLKRIVNE